MNYTRFRSTDLFHSLNAHKFSALVVSLLTTRLHVQLINTPVVQILFEGHRTPFLSQVKLASPVEIDNCTKVTWMSVKIIFIVLNIELVTQLKYLLNKSINQLINLINRC